MGPALDFTGWCRIPSADGNDTGWIRKGGQEPDPEGLRSQKGLSLSGACLIFCPTHSNPSGERL